MVLPKITVDGSLKGQVKVDDEHNSTNATTLILRRAVAGIELSKVTGQVGTPTYKLGTPTYKLGLHLQRCHIFDSN